MSENELNNTPILPEEDGCAMASCKQPKRISLTAFITSAVALVLIAVMLTYTVCSGYYRKKLIGEQSVVPTVGTSVDDSLALFAALFDAYSVKDVNVDDQQVLNGVLKEYVRQTGDTYAFYYTAEELLELQKSNIGESQGIGINIIQSKATIGGAEYDVIKVINVIKDSPAAAAGVQNGDLIVYVGVGADREPVYSLGYEMAVSKLQGVKGTVASFTVYRPNGTAYDVKEFNIERNEFTSWSVDSHVCTVEGYGDVGIVKIMQFDLTTPTQFCEAVDGLLAQGCQKIVFDVRHNPGGDLKSIEAVLSYFLQENDVIIRTRDKSGNEEIARVGVSSYTGDYAGCSVSREDIGKYRDKFASVVLCNGNTASAAELFTAAFRDYELATIVGTKTFGKGSMQSIMSLAMFGMEGALKLTTKMYYPPKGDSYEGLGIVPNVVIEQSEEAAKINIYEIRDAEDDQLVEALAHF